MRSRPKAPLPPKRCIDKRWWQPICELIGELMKEEMPARWAQPLPGGESGAPRPPGVLLAHFGLPCALLEHLLHTACTVHTACTLLAHTPCTLLAHSCLRTRDATPTWRGVSVARKCVQHALVPPRLLCPLPPAPAPATSTKHFLETAKNLALAIRRLKPNHEKRWQLCKLQNRKCFITALTII